MRRLHKSLLLFIGLLALSMAVQAKDKKVKAPKKEPQDQIEVVGHLVVANGQVTRFITTRHYSSFYLYVEYAASKTVTLVDMTRAAQPAVLADVSYPAGEGNAALFSVAGTAAIVTEGAASAVPTPAAQTVRIMDFSDPKQPKVAREFAGVTAISKDDQRGLSFLANPEGIWILHQSLALDPEIEKEYARHVLYDH